MVELPLRTPHSALRTLYTQYTQYTLFTVIKYLSSSALNSSGDTCIVITCHSVVGKIRVYSPGAVVTLIGILKSETSAVHLYLISYPSLPGFSSTSSSGKFA